MSNRETRGLDDKNLENNYEYNSENANINSNYVEYKNESKKQQEEVHISKKSIKTAVAGLLIVAVAGGSGFAIGKTTSYGPRMDKPGQVAEKNHERNGQGPGMEREKGNNEKDNKNDNNRRDDKGENPKDGRENGKKDNIKGERKEPPKDNRNGNGNNKNEKRQGDN